MKQILSCGRRLFHLMHFSCHLSEVSCLFLLLYSFLIPFFVSGNWRGTMQAEGSLIELLELPPYDATLEYGDFIPEVGQIVSVSVLHIHIQLTTLSLLPISFTHVHTLAHSLFIFILSPITFSHTTSQVYITLVHTPSISHYVCSGSDVCA